MSFNTLNVYSAVHKAYDHVGNMAPDVEHSEGQRPSHDGFMPAAWLPVKFFDKHYENWVTVLPGKILALDPDGRFMPAQYGLTSATLTYTQNDVDAGVIDIRTGVAVTTAATVTLSDVDGSTYSFMGRTGVSFADATKKYPVGVCWSPMLQWAGDGSLEDDGFNPAYYRNHNYNMQHKVAPLLDYVIKLPLIPGQAANESLPNSWTNSTLLLDGTGGWRTRTYTQACARYNATTGLYPILSSYPVIALSLDNRPIAKNTTRTPITSNLTGLLVTEVDGPEGVRQSGDFWIDYEMGTLFVYSATGDSLPALTGSSTITYWHNSAAPSAFSAFGCVAATTTELVPGDYLKCDSNSNFVRVDPESDSFFDVVGQVLAVDDKFPKDYLDRVRTAYSPALQTAAIGTLSNGTAATLASQNRGQLDQLTGSATGGIPTLITYAGGSNTIVLINLIAK